MTAAKPRPSPRTKRTKRMNYLCQYWMLYAMLALPMAFFVVFRYLPMTNIVMAFKDYNIFKGVWDSPWAGMKWFQQAFATWEFHSVLRNTITLNVLDLLVGFPIPILLAVLLNELSFRRYKRITQTTIYLPHFLSWVIISGRVKQLLGPQNGVINLMLSNLGLGPIDFLQENRLWVGTYIALGAWKDMGWNTIIYLAAITAINTELYEAAEVDGAGRMRKIWHVTLPGITPIIMVLLIMNIVIALICFGLILICLLPFVNLLARSLSSPMAIINRKVSFLPVEFSAAAYARVLMNAAFSRSMLWTIELTLLCSALSMTLTALCAFPLTYDKLKGGKLINALIILTMYFSAGTVPNYAEHKDWEGLQDEQKADFPDSGSRAGIGLVRRGARRGDAGVRGDEGVTHDLVGGLPMLKSEQGTDKIMNSGQNIDYTIMVNGLDLGDPGKNAKAITLSYSVDPQLVLDAYNIAMNNGKADIVIPVTLVAAGPVTQTLIDKSKEITDTSVRCSIEDFDSVWAAGI